MEKLSHKASNYCLDHFKTQLSDIKFIDGDLEHVVSVKHEPIHLEQKLVRYLSNYQHLQLIYDMSGLKDKPIQVLIFDSLLIQAIQSQNLPFLCELLLDITTYKIKLSNIFFEAVNYLIRQELLTGSSTGFFFIDKSVSEKTRFLFELKIALCLSKIAEYLKSEYYHSNHAG